MKEYIRIFNKHRDNIENFLTNIIQNNSLSCSDDTNIRSAFKNLKALQNIYLVNSDYKQISATHFKSGSDATKKGASKEQYFSNIRFNEKNIFMTNPYLHHRTGKPSITIVRLVNGDFVVFDIDLLVLLEELRLIEHNSKFDKLNRVVYAIGGYLLSFISIFLLLYGGYIFFNIFFTSSEVYIINEMFKSIIAITLGLAIYDLAKTIIAHEVLFKNLEDDKGGQYHILGKFLISIIIALSIESLMVVFKIALDDYTSLGYAFFLILGVTILIIGLGVFHHLTKDKCSVE